MARLIPNALKRNSSRYRNSVMLTRHISDASNDTLCTLKSGEVEKVYVNFELNNILQQLIKTILKSLILTFMYSFVFSVKTLTTTFVVALLYTITTATENIGSSLLKDLVPSGYDKNTIVSPFSAETCLAMIRMGAGGKTSQELDKILNLSKSVLNVLPDNYHNELAKYVKAEHFKFANKIYVKNGQSINEDFKTLLAGKFFSSAENMDFSQTEKAAEAINEWVASTTGNTINNLEENLQPNTDLLLVSSVNFNGPWKTGFNANWTKPDKFYVDEDDNFVMVPMMKVRSYFRYGRQAAMNAGAILLPYREAGLSMLVVVPFRADGLDKVLTTMKSMDMPTFIETKVFQRKSIEFRMPKFKMNVTVNLKDSLKNVSIYSRPM